MTPLVEQATNLCFRYIRGGETGYISKYELNESVLAGDEANVLRFDEYSGDWLDFVMSCRRGDDDTKHDIVIGGVANDKVFNTIELFFDKLISKEEALGRLRYEKPNLQICIRAQSILDEYLQFLGYDEVK